VCNVQRLVSRRENSFGAAYLDAVDLDEPVGRAETGGGGRAAGVDCAHTVDVVSTAGEQGEAVAATVVPRPQHADPGPPTRRRLYINHNTSFYLGS